MQLTLPKIDNIKMAATALTLNFMLKKKEKAKK